MNDDSRLDLTALDPDADGSLRERSGAAIAARLATSLARRRARPQLFWSELASRRVPLLAAGSALAALSILVLLRLPAPPPSVTVGTDHLLTIAEASGVPAAIAVRLEPVADAAMPETGVPHE